MSETRCSRAAPLDERPLVEGAKRDGSAFAELYRRHHRAIAGYLLRRIGDHHEAEDLTAEVFLSALRALPRFRPGKVAFRWWLMRIATNAANRWARTRRRKPPPMMRGDVPEVCQVPTLSDGDRELAQSALLRLKPRAQTVLSLHYFESLPLEQVAVILNCRVGTVKSRLNRAREAMRRELERLGESHA